jgi:hypothetical protein
MGKNIFNYILESDSDDQLLAFLSIPNTKNESRISRKQKQYMKFFNAQMTTHNGKCLVSRCIELIMSDQFDTFRLFRPHLMNYFEEVGDVKIDARDKIIDELIEKLRHKATTKQQWLELNSIVRLMVSYWRDGGRHYRRSKERIIDFCSPFRLTFDLAEENFDDFFRFFETKTKEVAKAKGRHFMRDFLFDLFNLAIRKRQKKAIETIIESSFFENFEAYQPENINACEIHHFTALKLLREGKEGTLQHFPDEWFTIGVIKEFLDSVVSVYNQQYVEMDLSLMSNSVGLSFLNVFNIF